MPMNPGECPITLIVTEEFKVEVKMYCLAHRLSLQAFGGQVFMEVGKKLMLKNVPVINKAEGTGLRRDFSKPLKEQVKAAIVANERKRVQDIEFEDL